MLVDTPRNNMSHRKRYRKYNDFDGILFEDPSATQKIVSKNGAKTPMKSYHVSTSPTLLALPIYNHTLYFANTLRPKPCPCHAQAA